MNQIPTAAAEPLPHAIENPTNAEGTDSIVRRAAFRALGRNSFCTFATSSPRNRPHVVGVVYAMVDGVLYIHTIDTSRKARNVRTNPHAGVCVPVRRLPFAPPFCVQFQARAELLPADHPDIVELITTRPDSLSRITGHGALAFPGTCFLRVTPDRTISTFGVGVPLLEILRDPFHANRTARLDRVAE